MGIGVDLPPHGESPPSKSIFEGGLDGSWRCSIWSSRRLVLEVFNDMTELECSAAFGMFGKAGSLQDQTKAYQQQDSVLIYVELQNNCIFSNCMSCFAFSMGYLELVNVCSFSTSFCGVDAA